MSDADFLAGLWWLLAVAVLSLLHFLLGARRLRRGGEEEQGTDAPESAVNKGAGLRDGVGVGPR